MSKGLGKVLDILKLSDAEYENDEYEDDDDDFEEEDYAEEYEDDTYEEPVKKKSRFKPSFSKKKSEEKTRSSKKYEYEDDDFDDIEDDIIPSNTHYSFSSKKEQKNTTSFGKKKEEKIVPLHSVQRGAQSMEVCVSRPVDFDTCQEISDIILSGKAAIINFEAVSTAEAQRIIDFVSGACYAVNGSAKQISNTIVVVTPEAIDITGDLSAMASSDVEVPTFDTEDY